MLRPLLILVVAAPVPVAAQVAPAPPPLIIPPPGRSVALPGAPRAGRQTASTEVSRNAPVNGVLTLYGNERCPTNGDGAEVVVCVRRGAAEQFRIPKELRTFEVTPENASWATRERANADVAASGVGSCSTVGAGGQTGCFVQQARRSSADVRARAKAATPDLPPN